MKNLMTKVRNFLREEDGATAPEYGLIAALIAVAIIVAVGNAGTAIEGVFQDIADSINGVAA